MERHELREQGNFQDTATVPEVGVITQYKIITYLSNRHFPFKVCTDDFNIQGKAWESLYKIHRPDHLFVL